MALPKVHRLRRRQDFNAVYQSGIKCTSPHLILRALSPRKQVNLADPAALNPLKERPPTQIGISISQKVSKRSVIRNRIKRQIRAAVYQLLPQLSPGWQLVVVVKPNATQCDYEQFLRELEQLLMNTEVWNGH